MDQHHLSHAPNVARSFASVSNEVFTLVLSHLPLIDILKVGRTCKRWHQASCDSAVWRRLFLRHFTVDLFHHPAPLLIANAFASAHGAQARHLCQAMPSVADSTGIQWKTLFRLQYCWANGRCSRRTIATGRRAIADTGDAPTALTSGAQTDDGEASVVSFLAVNGLVLLGKRNGEIATCPTSRTFPALVPQLMRIDPPAPILGLFHLSHGSQPSIDSQSTSVVALTPRRVHCFSLNSMSGLLSPVSSAKHSLFTSLRARPLKLLSLPSLRGSFVDESTLVLLVAPLISPSELHAASPSSHSSSSPSRAPTLSIMDPTTGALSHIMSGIPLNSNSGAFDVLATLNPNRFHLSVLVSMSTQLYTPSGCLEHHELRLQVIHFQRSPPSAQTRCWYHTDSQVILPTWTPNSLWPSPLCQQGIPLSAPVHHAPITSIRIAQELLVSAHTSSTGSSPPSCSSVLALRYLVATHRDHSISLYALVPASTSGPRLFFLGTLPDHVHSAILDVTITASIGRIVALCRDGNARVWQLEPWFPVTTTMWGEDSESVTSGASESKPMVDYDVLFHRPSLSYTRKSRFSLLHLRNATPTHAHVPRASADEQDVPKGHDHQGVAGSWHAVDAGDATNSGSAWEQKRVRADALVAEIPVLERETLVEDAGWVWIHVVRDQLVCAQQDQVVCLNFAE